MIKIHAAVGDTTEIDILGDIGSSWFSEGNTLQTVKAQIDGIKSKNIIINIASFGGDADEGFSIHSYLSSKKAYKTARLLGSTASAGTIVAMSADEIQISENARFLIHNSWTQAVGNAEQLRKTASTLDKVDVRMIAIYKKKTGKSEEEIKDLMAREEWLSADEAKDFGLVDEVTEASKIAALYTPELMASVTKNFQTKNNKMNPTENKEPKEASVLSEIKEALFAIVGNKKEDYTEQIDAKVVEFKEKYMSHIEEADKKIKEASEKVEANAKAIEAKDAEIAELKAAKEALSEELAKAKGTPVSAEPKADESPEAIKSENHFDSIAANFKNKFKTK